MLPVDLHIMRPVYNITTPVKYVFALQQDTMHRYYEHIWVSKFINVIKMSLCNVLSSSDKSPCLARVCDLRSFERCPIFWLIHVGLRSLCIVISKKIGLVTGFIENLDHDLWGFELRITVIFAHLFPAT